MPGRAAFLEELAILAYRKCKSIVYGGYILQVTCFSRLACGRHIIIAKIPLTVCSDWPSKHGLPLHALEPRGSHLPLGKETQMLNTQYRKAGHASTNIAIWIRLEACVPLIGFIPSDPYSYSLPSDNVEGIHTIKWRVLVIPSVHHLGIVHEFEAPTQTRGWLSRPSYILDHIHPQT